MPDNEDPIKLKDDAGLPPVSKLDWWKWWLLVAANVGFLLFGQSAAVILQKFYYEQGGHSKWLATLVQTVGFPLLFIPFILFPSMKEPAASPPPRGLVYSVYLGLGAVVAAGNLLCSVGLLHLSASTYSLVRTTQLAFHAAFSFLAGPQRRRPTSLVLNSLVALSLAAALLAVNGGSDRVPGVKRDRYALGVAAALCASALYALLLSLAEVAFRRAIRKRTFSVVLETQIHTSAVATCVAVVGLFASGEWRGLRAEVGGFRKGSSSYAMTLVWAALAWQVGSVGLVGLVFVVSSVYSNVISTLSMAATPLAAVVVFHDKMNGVKIIAMIMGVWGLSTYLYQNYLDGLKARKKHDDDGGGGRIGGGGGGGSGRIGGGGDSAATQPKSC